MIRLIKIEFKKILSYRVFWLLVGFYAVSLTFMLIVAQVIINEILREAGQSAPIPLLKISLYQFPRIWNNLTYMAGFLTLFLAIIVIFFVCNEYSNKTFRQNIINGLSRNEFVLSKLYFILIISLAATLLILVVGLVLGLIHTKDVDFGDIFNSKLQFIAGYFVEAFCYLLFAFFIAFLLKKAGLAVITLLFYTMIEQILIWWKIPAEYVKFFPMKAFGRLVHFPKIPLPEINGSSIHFQDHVSLADTGIALLYAGILIFLIYRIMHKRDI
ncbi:MAG TPA: ABC transporter permease [Bacteroidales bacterium]|nr:ABC transporter permease [Bacteroidales bacterium]HNS45942.1 ABC transporter permease [Bacteroidales bacterium]